MDIKLQILVPTMPVRAPLLKKLLATLQKQINCHPGARFMVDDGDGSIGAKRQRMIEAATAEYICFVDDDDRISPDYLDRIMPCLASGPDVVGITMHVRMDGKDYHPSPIFRHSLRFRDNTGWRDNDRPPHHLCPMRREIALRSRFPDLMWGEDYNFALGVLPHLHTEEWSGDDPLYFYDYYSRKPFDSGA